MMGPLSKSENFGLWVFFDQNYKIDENRPWTGRPYHYKGLKNSVATYFGGMTDLFIKIKPKPLGARGWGYLNKQFF